MARGGASPASLAGGAKEEEEEEDDDDDDEKLKSSSEGRPARGAVLTRPPLNVSLFRTLLGR